MNRGPGTSLRVALIAAAVIAALAAPPVRADWSQWGGPSRDFVVARGAASLGWSQGAPPILWRRPLGPGYSAVVSDGERLFTMTRRGDDEVVVALAADTGETVWEHAYPAPVADGPALDTSWGSGPNSTPLIVGKHLYTLGFTGILNCFDTASGTLVWRHDLAARQGAAPPYFGHSASPIRYRDLLIVPVAGALAFRLDSGAPVWQARGFTASYASPVLWRLPAGTQLVVPAAGEVVALDPDDGRLLWRHDHANRARTILSDAIPGDDRLLFVSAYFLGSVGLELAADGESVKEVWETSRLQLAQSNAIRADDVVYGFNNSVLVALDVTSGEVLWRERGFERANLIRVGERFLLFDRLGKLSLVSLSRQGVTGHAEAQLLEGRSWTAPTLIGECLYVRNLESIVAVDLSRSVDAPPVAPTLPVRPQVSAPAEFLAAHDRLMTAYRRGDVKALDAAGAQIESWRDDETLGHLAGYYLGFALYQRALLAGNLALPLLRRAETVLEEVARREPTFADAHALLAQIYPMYYRFDPGRATVVGSLGDDHLETALRFEPDNPRVLAVQALDLIHSPAEYGGDPEAGLVLLRRALDRFAETAGQPADRLPRVGSRLCLGLVRPGPARARSGESRGGPRGTRQGSRAGARSGVGADRPSTSGHGRTSPAPPILEAVGL